MALVKAAPIATVTVTNVSSTLATLMATASKHMSTLTDRYLLVPFATGIFYNDGAAASALTIPMSTTAISVPLQKADIETIQFYAASPTGMAVWQFKSA